MNIHLISSQCTSEESSMDSRAVNKALNFNKLLAGARANMHHVAVIESMTFQLPRCSSRFRSRPVPIQTDPIRTKNLHLD